MAEHSHFTQLPQSGSTSFSGSTISLEGEIASAPAGDGAIWEQMPKTLDEPVSATIMRDLRSVGDKFASVYLPQRQRTLLKDWDLWGPLMLCVFLAIMLQSGNEELPNAKTGTAPHFAQLFVLVWFGATLVTLNCALLGSNISVFQGICVLGYCLLAPCIALVLCKLVLYIPMGALVTFLVTLLITLAGGGWSVYASTTILNGSEPNQDRWSLVAYPIALYYFTISWLILSWSHHKC